MRLEDIEGAKAVIRQTRWFYGYTTGVKRVMSTECQGFTGVVEAVCIRGGIVTQVEEEEMDAILRDARVDARKNGVVCRIEKRTLSYAQFRTEYGMVGKWRWLGWLVPRSLRAARRPCSKGMGDGDELLGGDEEADAGEGHVIGFTMVILTGTYVANNSSYGYDRSLLDSRDYDYEACLVVSAGPHKGKQGGDAFSWTMAREQNGQSARVALRAAAARLVLWHWLQPLLYFLVYYSFYGQLDAGQKLFGAGVALREAMSVPPCAMCLLCLEMLVCL